MIPSTSPRNSSPSSPSSTPPSTSTSSWPGSLSSSPRAASPRAAPPSWPTSLTISSYSHRAIDLDNLMRPQHCYVFAARVSSLFSWRTRMRIGVAGKWFIAGIVVTTILCTSANAQQFDQKLYSEMRWRWIGPFRGGRTVAISGVPHQPSVFYMAAVNGGVWKTTDFGNTWNPIFDDQPTGSVGAIAIAPSDPNILYVGSGEGLHRPDLSVGDGVYKSTDAGKTWTHLGLRDAQQIPTIVVDPNDPNRLFVAVLGHPYGPNEERGIFRSTDGGKTFQKVLYKNDFTGGIDVILDPSNAQTVYAALWQAQQGPWENAYFAGPASGFFKSTDGGTTWNELKSG